MTDHIAGLSRALREVLACPHCQSSLLAREQLHCTSCARRYPIDSGILMFLDGSNDNVAQRDERELRERVMRDQSSTSADEILSLVARHHSPSVMAQRARRFRAAFDQRDWILDIGAGSGWVWREGRGAALLLLDFSLESLRVARRLLSNRDDVIYLWADVGRLPLQQAAIAGAWSVQVFQHFPAEVFARALQELNRVMTDDARLEIYNLNPAPALRLLYRIAGRRFHLTGRLGEMELNRLSAPELRQAWRAFRADRSQMSTGYSELFFHPDFRLRPSYPARLEEWLATAVPSVAALFARQVHIRLQSRTS